MGLVMGDLVPAGRALDPRYLARSARAMSERRADARRRVLRCVTTDDAGSCCAGSAADRCRRVWTLPGGGLDFGESPTAAVVRELTEETGLDGEVVDLLDVTDRVVDEPRGVRMHAIRIIYRVRITGGELRNEPDGSTDMCRWFAPDGGPSSISASWPAGPRGRHAPARRR